MSNQSFITSIASGAVRAQTQYGICASLTIAQAILESGWGASAPGNNLFGIKWTAGYSYASAIRSTKEEYNGVWETINAAFRVYDTLADSVYDHAQFIVNNSRYHNLLGVTNYVTACNLIKEDGYATDSSYPTQLVEIISENNLNQYDSASAVITPTVPSAETKIIQTQLNAMTKAGLTVDGLGGTTTQQKIQQFQVIMGITADGVWNADCVNCVNQIYALPPCGIAYTQPSATRLIQFRLGLTFDGIFGGSTETVLINWQKANNIAENGVFGGKSWNYLLNGIKPAIVVAPVTPVVVKPVVPVVAPLATIQYATYVQNLGLQGFVSNDEIAGTVGQGLRIEALTINYIGKGVLTFQVYLQGTGWQTVVSNGQMAGTLGQGLRIEAVRIFLAGSPMTLTYSVEVENQGWQPYVGSGIQAGTTGLGLRMEAIKIKLS